MTFLQIERDRYINRFVAERVIPTRGAAAAFAAGTVAGTTMFVTRVGPSLKNGDFFTKISITTYISFYKIPPSNLIFEYFSAYSKYTYSDCAET